MLRVEPPPPKITRETEYLVFHETHDTGKTKQWSVVSRRHGDPLGRIVWYGPWRQYAFYSHVGTYWNTGCLADVQQFITDQMAARRAARERAKADG